MQRESPVKRAAAILDPARLVCLDCGSWIPRGHARCERCGGAGSRAGHCRPVVAVVDDTPPLPDPWTVLGSWPAGCLLSLTGPPGAGKSTLAAILARWSDAPGRPSTWITAEQSGAEVGAMFRRVTPGYCPDVAVVADPGAAVAHVNGARGLVVVDSLTALAEWAGQVDILGQIDAWAQGGEGRRAVVILQVNADGEGAGRREIPHLVDAVAVVAPAEGLSRLDLTKNRNGPAAGVYFSIGAGGIAVPRWPYAYSVEGERGSYRLHPYPVPGARWAGVLAMLHAQGTLRPGTASAAIPCDAYPGGAAEPGDIAARRQFAELHGLAWLEPGECNLSRGDE